MADPMLIIACALLGTFFWLIARGMVGSDNEDVNRILLWAIVLAIVFFVVGG